MDGSAETAGVAQAGAVQAGEGAREAQGRALVRAVLVARLDGAGMVRRKGQTQAQHNEWVSRLCDRLAYMSPVNLDVLAEEMVTRGQGAGKNEWPSEVVILTWARGLQAPPFRQLPIVTSWLHSVEGPLALAGGYLVELTMWLRRYGRPPSDYDMRQIRADADDNRRRAERARGRIAAGTPWQDDLAWMEARLRDEAFARQIVAAGIDHREAKGAENGAT